MQPEHVLSEENRRPIVLPGEPGYEAPSPRQTNVIPFDRSGTFFDRSGILHATLREAVLDLGAIAAGPGRSLWRYRNGVWLADGDDEVRRRVSMLLNERYRRAHAEGVVDELRAREPFITDDPVTDWINCANGLLDWSTGQLFPHTELVPSTYQLAVNWNPDATCPQVDAWLSEVAPDDALDLVWEVIGVSIYADMPVHRAVLLVGPGRNGKGTFLRLVQALIGRRHISAITLQALAERFAPAELFGKVANIAGDLDARSIKRTDIFKMATGGDLINAERKNGQPFTFTNRATMLFSANEAPGSDDLTDGFFARWVIVPFDRLRLAPGQEDPAIEERLHTELEGVLVKAVAGLRRVIAQHGFTMPTSVATAGAAYRENADPVRRFADDCLVITGDHEHRKPRAAVYEAYKSWCNDNGHRHLAAARFYDHIGTTFPQVNAKHMSNGTRYVTGAYLTPEVDRA